MVGRRFPKILGKPALIVVFFDPKHHAHGHADAERALIDVGHVGQQPPALGEGAHWAS